jgi:hypothetical protein
MPVQYLFRAVVLMLATTCAACAQDHPKTAAAVTKTSHAGCLDAGDGRLQARLRGELVADLDWSNAQMTCEGGTRPDGSGLRVSIVGPLAAPEPGKPAKSLRFIFGIDLKDAAKGPAQALPTNLTAIVEGQKQLFSTRGGDHCAVEVLERTQLMASKDRRERVHARGYCTDPAIGVNAGPGLLVATFEFTARIDVEDSP